MSQHTDKPRDERQEHARKRRGYDWMDYLLAPEYVDKNNTRSRPSELEEASFPTVSRLIKRQKSAHD